MSLRALSLAMFVSLLAAAPASAASLPGLASCGSSYYGAKVKPKEWSSGCTGSSFNVEKLRWSRWTTSSASGKGVDRSNDCEPSCAEGTITEFAATLKLSRPRRCYSQKGRIRMFTRVRYSTQAAGGVSGTFDITCLTKRPS